MWSKAVRQVLGLLQVLVVALPHDTSADDNCMTLCEQHAKKIAYGQRLAKHEQELVKHCRNAVQNALEIQDSTPGFNPLFSTIESSPKDLAKQAALLRERILDCTSELQKKDGSAK